MSEADILEWLGDIPGNELGLSMLASQLQTPVGVVPFVGAGMSAPFGFPQWTAFLGDAARLAGRTRAIRARVAAGEYEEAAQDLIAALTPGRFQDLIEHRFGDGMLRGKALTGAIGLVPRLSTGPVITTNFDRVLERVFQEAGSPFEIVVWHSKVDLAIGALKRNGTALLKLHGDWEDPDHRVLTLNEYTQHYGTAGEDVDFSLPLPQLFKLLAVRPVLFLGCSLSEDRTVRVLRRVASDLKTSRHYAIVQKPARASAFRERGRFLATHNIVPIWYPEGEHHRVERLLEYLCTRIPDVHRRQPRAPADAAPSPTPPASTIPSPLTTFVGRARELEALHGLAGAPGLITVTGAPGSGKTRVAIALARRLAPAVEGTWFVQLSQLPEAHLVAQRVGAVLGIREQARRPPTESLAEFIGEHRYLLVLDNCEHVRPACTELADYLLRHCRALTIVATSREVLRVAGERVYRMPPLAMPDAEAVGDASAILRLDAVQLLVERAGPSLRLTAASARDVAALCRELDGLPLAIELAAAQLSSLTVRQVLQHMNERLKLLAGGVGGSEERQWTTLREAIQFCYNRLEPEQEVLFRRLAVFSRGCTWDAATDVCRTDPQDRFDILRLLNELHARSLLAVEEGADEKRFRMLDSIREFATGALEAAGELQDIRRKHAVWFVGLAERAEPELLRKDQARWLDRLNDDADNLRGAILWSVRQNELEFALRLVASLWRLVEIRGYLREGRERLEMVLAMPGTSKYPALRSKAASGVGMLAYRLGDMAAAERFFSESLAIEEERQNQAGMANALNDLGNVAQMQGDFETARWRYERSLALERETHNARGVAVGLFNLGNCARRLGRLDEAEDLYTNSLRGFEADGNLREAAFPLNGLGQVALARGRYGEAITHAERSLTIRRDLSDKKGMADSLRTLAAVRLATREMPAAFELLSESLVISRGVEDKRGIAEALEQFAAAAAAQHDHAAIVTLYAAAQQLRDDTLVRLAPLEQALKDTHLAAANAALGPDEVTRLEAAGRRMSLAELVEATTTAAAGVAGRSS